MYFVQMFNAHLSVISYFAYTYLFLSRNPQLRKGQYYKDYGPQIIFSPHQFSSLGMNRKYMTKEYILGDEKRSKICEREKSSETGNLSQQLTCSQLFDKIFSSPNIQFTKIYSTVICSVLRCALYSTVCIVQRVHCTVKPRAL